MTTDTTEQTSAANPVSAAEAAAGLPPPELKRIVGAMLFAAKKPLPLAEIRRVITQVAAMQAPEDGRKPASDGEIRAALTAVKDALEREGVGVTLGIAPGAGDAGAGFRLQTDPACGPWLRCMLELGKPTRLSRPALETLAIIAYRQPVGRAEIEGVRGVSVDAMLRTLLEMQLIKITGRSELPGRPLLYGTTQLFLEHFGLKNVRDLPGIEQLCRREAERALAAAAAQPESGIDGNPADDAPAAGTTKLDARPPDGEVEDAPAEQPTPVKALPADQAPGDDEEEDDDENEEEEEEDEEEEDDEEDEDDGDDEEEK